MPSARALERGTRRRGAVVPRDEDVPAHAALDAGEPARRPRPGRCRGVGAEGSAAAVRGAAPRDAASSTTSASPRSAQSVEADVEAAVDAALADEDCERRTICCRRSSPRIGAIPAPPAAGRAAQLGFVAAIREALDLELAADPDVIVIGEDVGRVGGLFRATEGLYERYGADRIRDTPLTESGFVGCGIGAALTGLRPVVELQFSDFAGVAFDQIMNQAAKLRFMMGGAPTMPLVIRMVGGAGVRLGAQHSQSLEALFAHIPGLVVVMPSNPFDAKGLLAAAIQDDNPVIFLEQKLLFFGDPAPVPEERYAIELGTARVVRAGSDVTVVALGAMVPHALRVARELEDGRRERRGRRPADARAARHGHDRGVGGEDAPARRRARGRAVRRASEPRSRPTSPSTASGSSTRRWSGSARRSTRCRTRRTSSSRPCPGPAEIAAAVAFARCLRSASAQREQRDPADDERPSRARASGSPARAGRRRRRPSRSRRSSPARPRPRRPRPARAPRARARRRRTRRNPASTDDEPELRPHRARVPCTATVGAGVAERPPGSCSARGT